VTLSSSRLRQAFSGLLLPPPAISSSFLLPPVELSSHGSVLASYRHDLISCAFIYCAILLCLYSSFISLFVFLLQPPSSVLVPLKIFLSVFLSHASSFISLFFVNTQVSHPYTTAGLTTVLYILIFAALEISLTLAFCLVNPLPCFLCSLSCLSPALLRYRRLLWNTKIKIWKTNLLISFNQTTKTYVLPNS
jgi:hypothetical protein